MRARVLPRMRLAVAAGTLCACAAGAQPAPGADTGCVRSAPAAAFTRVPVFVHAEVVDSADRQARTSVDLVAQEVADRIRVLVRDAGARTAPPPDAATTLPAADSTFGRDEPTARLRVVAWSDGRPLAWRAERPDGPDTTRVDTVGAALLARALGAAVAEQAVLIPDLAIRGDSLVFVLAFTRPAVEGPELTLGPVRERNPSPAFSLRVPWARPAATVPGTLRLRYPETSLYAGYEGNATMQFVVGVDGRAESRTIRDLWPTDVPRLAGRDLDAYTAFVAAARAAIVNARYRPAVVAGCTVRQLVEQPLTWTMGR